MLTFLPEDEERQVWLLSVVWWSSQNGVVGIHVHPGQIFYILESPSIQLQPTDASLQNQEYLHTLRVNIICISSQSINLHMFRINDMCPYLKSATHACELVCLYQGDGKAYACMVNIRIAQWPNTVIQPKIMPCLDPTMQWVLYSKS